MEKKDNNTTKNVLITFILAIIAVAALLGSGVVVFSPPASITGEVDGSEVIKEQLQERHIIDFYEAGGGTIVYSYRGEQILGKLADDENIEKRTLHSYTRDLGTNEQGEPTFNTIFYSQDKFLKEGGEWYFIEHGFAPKDIFDREYSSQKQISQLLFKKAYAEDIDSGAGDGDTCVHESTWDAAHDSTSGGPYSLLTCDNGGSNSTSTEMIVMSLDSDIKGSPYYAIRRGFLPFDTSSIPASATILSASLNVYATSTTNGDNDGDDFITVVQTSQATHTILDPDDYDQCGAINSPTEGIDSGDRKDITSISTGAFLTFDLNSTGMGWITKSGESSNCSGTNGITCLGLREGHDVVDTETTGTHPVESSATFSTSETADDPYLSVTYSSFVPWQFFPF